MRPPETALLRAGNVFGSVGVGMMMTVIRRPGGRRARAVEHGAEGQKMFDDLIQLECVVRQQAVIANRSTESAEADQNQGRKEYLPSRKRKQNQPNHCQHM